MYRFLMEILTDPLGLPVRDLWEYAILAVLAMLAFGLGWQVSCRSLFGFVMHWVARLLAFLVLWVAMYALLAALQWVFAHLVLVCCTIIMAVAVMVITSVTGPRQNKRQIREVTA